MEITYQVENYEEIIESAKPLFEKHYREIARNQEKIKLNPDYDLYKKMEDKDGLHIVTVRGDGKLIGYFVSFLAPHPHYQDHVMASNDIFYIDPIHRKGSVGSRMVKFALKSLKERGVSVVHTHTKIEHDISSFLERIGGKKIEYVHEFLLI